MKGKGLVLLFVMVTAILLLSVLSACSNSVLDGEGFAYVWFNLVDGAKSLTRDVEGLENCKYWEYTAVKKTSIDFKKGETTSRTACSIGKSFGPFSLGTWEFSLYAYNNESEKKLMFSCEGIEKELTASGDGRVSMLMKPSISDSGTGMINVQSVPLGESGSVYSNYVKIYEEGTDESGAVLFDEALPSGGKSYEVPSGRHCVVVSYVEDDATHSYDGKIVITVYDNVTTTIGGFIPEVSN